MSKRKPLEPGCTGSILCPIAGHVVARTSPYSRITEWSHIPLTAGQRKTLREQAEAGRGWFADIDRATRWAAR